MKMTKFNYLINTLTFTFMLSKFKGSREVKNLGCSINYDARGLGSRRGKAKRPNVMY